MNMSIDLQRSLTFIPITQVLSELDQKSQQIHSSPDDNLTITSGPFSVFSMINGAAISEVADYPQQETPFESADMECSIDEMATVLDMFMQHDNRFTSLDMQSLDPVIYNNGLHSHPGAMKDDSRIVKIDDDCDLAVSSPTRSRISIGSHDNSNLQSHIPSFALGRYL
jgi:hypothetical protein